MPNNEDIPLSTAQTQLDRDLQVVPTIRAINSGINALKDNQQEILDTVKKEIVQTKADFKRGEEKFRELTEGLAKVRIEVGEMKSQIIEGFRNQREDLAKHLTETKDNQFTELKKTVEHDILAQSERKSRINHIKDGILISLVGGISLAVATVLIYSFFGTPIK